MLAQRVRPLGLSSLRQIARNSKLGRTNPPARFLTVRAGPKVEGLGRYMKYGLAASSFVGGATFASRLHNSAPIKQDIEPVVVDGMSEFDHIIVGGGSAGCVSAYFLAKWMEEFKIPGTVLLVDRGPGYEKANPQMSGWFENWGNFGKVHEAVAETPEGEEPYSVTPSDHRGLGGCGAHDTRIFFMPSEDDRAQYAKTLGLNQVDFDTYLQTALNLEPIVRSSEQGEVFFNRSLEIFAEKSGLNRLKDDRFYGEVVPESAAYFDVGAYPKGSNQASRWTSALLVNDGSDGVRPQNLKVLKGVEADFVQFESGSRVSGVVVQEGGERKAIKLTEQGDLTIAAGSIGSPSILQRSGIGDPKLLKKVGVKLRFANSEVGHGVDHEEVAVQYEPPGQWPEGETPLGGLMGWAVGIFKRLEGLDRMMQAHFSISGPPYNGETAVVGTPNNAQPDLTKGYRVRIQSLDPQEAAKLVHEESAVDRKVFLQGVREMIGLFEALKKEGVVGGRLDPLPQGMDGGVDLDDDEELWGWIKENKGSAYHWLSTCKAGLVGMVTPGSVANEKLQVRQGVDSPKVIDNLYVTSGAALPFPPFANPHVTVQTFAVYEAWIALQAMAKKKGIAITEPSEMRLARQQLKANHNRPQVRGPGEESPKLGGIASEYFQRHKDAIKA